MAASTSDVGERLAALRTRLESRAGTPSSGVSMSPTKLRHDDKGASSPVKPEPRSLGPRSALGELSSNGVISSSASNRAGLAVQPLALYTSAPASSSSAPAPASPSSTTAVKGKRQRAQGSPFIARILEQQRQTDDVSSSSASPNPRAKKVGRQSSAAAARASASPAVSEPSQAAHGTQAKPTAKPAPRKSKARTDTLFRPSAADLEDEGEDESISDIKVRRAASKPRSSAPEGPSGGSSQSKSTLRGEESFLREIRENGWDTLGATAENESPVRVRYVYGPPLPTRQPRTSVSGAPAVKAEASKKTSKGRKSAPARTAEIDDDDGPASSQLSGVGSISMSQLSATSKSSVQYSWKERASTLEPPVKLEPVLLHPKLPDSPGEDPLLLKGQALVALAQGGEADVEEEDAEASFSQATIDRQRARSQSAQPPAQRLATLSSVDALKAHDWSAANDASDSESDAEQQDYDENDELPPLADDHDLPASSGQTVTKLPNHAQDSQEISGDSFASLDQQPESSQEVSDGLIDSQLHPGTQQSEVRPSQSASMIGEEGDSGDVPEDAEAADDDVSFEDASDASAVRDASMRPLDDDEEEDGDDSIEMLGNSRDRSRSKSPQVEEPPRALHVEEALRTLDVADAAAHEDPAVDGQTADASISIEEVTPVDDAPEAEQSVVPEENTSECPSEDAEQTQEDQDASMDSITVDLSIAAVPQPFKRLAIADQVETKSDEDVIEEHESCNAALNSEEAQASPAPRRLLADRTAVSLLNASSVANVSAERSQMLARITPTPIIEISSVDADAAARAAAVLKHYARYIEEGTLVEDADGPAAIGALEPLMQREEERLRGAARRPAVATPSASATFSLISTPKPPGAFPLSPVAPKSSSATSSTPRTWRKADWQSLEKALVEQVEHDDAWAASRDVQEKKAAIAAIDAEDAVTSFLLGSGIHRSTLPVSGDWAESSLRSKVNSLKKMLCRYAEDLGPGRLQDDLRRARRAGPPSEVGSDTSRQSSVGAEQSYTGSGAAASSLARDTARISLGAAFARGAHSTPISRRAHVLPPPRHAQRPRSSLSLEPICASDLVRAKAGLAKPARAPLQPASRIVNKAPPAANTSVDNASTSSIYPPLPGAYTVRTSQGGQSKVQPTVLCTVGPEAVQAAQSRVKGLARSHAVGTWQSPLTLRRQQQQMKDSQAQPSRLPRSDSTFDSSKLFWQGKEK